MNIFAEPGPPHHLRYWRHAVAREFEEKAASVLSYYKQAAWLAEGDELVVCVDGCNLMSRVSLIICQINIESVTVLLVERNVRQALGMTTRGYVLETGRITRSFSGADLLHDSEIKRVYLGM